MTRGDENEPFAVGARPAGDRCTAYVKGANDTLDKLAKARRRDNFAEINWADVAQRFARVRATEIGL